MKGGDSITDTKKECWSGILLNWHGSWQISSQACMCGMVHYEIWK